MRIFLLLLGLLAIAETTLAANEMRILIDVSGSMKKTDPHNLRIPALRLLLELLPPETQAGVWLFAEDTKTLVPLASVDEPWRKKALKSSSKIHSRGLFTDIEKALQTVSKDWQDGDKKNQRNILLLTDGMVDVAKNPALNAASKARIEKELLPRLQQMGAHIYTIALSDQADHALLKRLSLATDGWSETADSAEELQRLFVKIFKKAVPRDGLPLNNNSFTVDLSVKEFTLLVFRKEGSPATELVKPDGSRWNYDQYPDSVRWRHEPTYDLITVAQPMPGQWQLVADVDPDNQVMIVTDLKLKVQPVPHYFSLGETLTVSAELTEHEKRITRKNFLKLVNFELKQQGESENTWLLQPDPEQTGVFRQRLKDELSPGTYELILTADGNTFQRQWTQSVEIIATPVQSEVTVEEDSEMPVQIHLTPDINVIDPGSFRAKALIADDQGHTLETDFIQAPDGGWVLKMKKPKGHQTLIVNFDIQAKSVQGQTLTPVLKPVTIDPSLFEDDEEAAGDAEEELEEDLEALEEADASETNWLLTGLIAAGLNLVLGIAGFFGWRWSQKRAQEQQEKLLSRLA
ncbi:MAG: hypothetical protein AXA67_07370 [Methylothermaceae bacteria B42]|nr:MAG: hypothetical protein AXA67_07370 [Methylothermaceae bacteria B42]HHJ40155.1 VWA domain-containing protein [Methylothermaceae bacterium]